MKKTYIICQAAVSLLICTLAGCGTSQGGQENSRSSVTAETVFETLAERTEPVKEMNVINETVPGAAKEAAETAKSSSVLVVYFSRCGIFSFMILGLAGCGNPAGSKEQTTAQTTAAESSAGRDISEAGNDTSADDRISADSGLETKVTGESSETSKEETEAGISEGEGGKVLVAEIIPEEPYTDADLNYNDSSSRTTIEMNDPDARPAISGAVENMEQYSVIFLGYPNMEQGLNSVSCA